MRIALPRLAPLAVAALLVFAGCNAPADASSDDRFADASWSSYQSSGCIGDASPNAGWLYWGANGERYAVAFNASLAGTSRVNASLDHTLTGVYTLTLTPTGGEAKPSASSSDCEQTADLGVSAAVPSDFREFRVVYDGRTLAVARNDGETTGELVDLPTPVNRSAA